MYVETQESGMQVYKIGQSKDYNLQDTIYSIIILLLLASFYIDIKSVCMSFSKEIYKLK